MLELFDNTWGVWSERQRRTRYLHACLYRPGERRQQPCSYEQCRTQAVVGLIVPRLVKELGLAPHPGVARTTTLGGLRLQPFTVVERNYQRDILNSIRGFRSVKNVGDLTYEINKAAPALRPARTSYPVSCRALTGWDWKPVASSY